MACSQHSVALPRMTFSKFTLFMAWPWHKSDKQWVLPT